jgi:hypothetical protein
VKKLSCHETADEGQTYWPRNTAVDFAWWIRTAETEKGDWIQYLCGVTDYHSKLAFVTNLTDRFYLGVGYETGNFRTICPAMIITIPGAA